MIIKYDDDCIRHIAVVAALLAPVTLHAETKEEWITLGARIHGAFGPFIPVGIRIGLDAVEKLKADPRGLTVTYYNGIKPPCPCVADGVMIATHASPGQGTLQISLDKAPDGAMAVIVIKNRKTGEGLKYTIDDAWLPKILGWIKSDPSARYDSAMSAEGLFSGRARPPHNSLHRVISSDGRLIWRPLSFQVGARFHRPAPR